MTPVSFLFWFQGRISRQAYWMFVLVRYAIILLPVFFVFGVESDGAVNYGYIMWLVLLWPWLAVQAKRWHDRDKSGWWILIYFLPVIGFFWILIENGLLRGTPGTNRFGPDPLDESDVNDRAAFPTTKLLQLVGGIALAFFGCLLSTVIVADVLFTTALEFYELAWGIVFTIGLWWAAYFYLHRVVSQPSGWRELKLVGGIALTLFGFLLLHIIALNFLFGTSEYSNLAIAMMFTIAFIAGGVFLAHRALSEPSAWQKTTGLVYGKRLAIIISVFVAVFVAFNGYVFYGTFRFFDKVQASLRENAIFQKYIGEVVRLREDYTATGSKGWNDVYVFKVKGTNGSGTVTAELKTVDRKSERLMSGTVVLESGETYDLFPGNR